MIFQLVVRVIGWGVLPIGLFSDHKFDLTALDLKGTISSAFGEFGLSSLGLGINCFSGTVPTNIGGLTQLVELQLECQLFSGICTY